MAGSVEYAYDTEQRVAFDSVKDIGISYAYDADSSLTQAAYAYTANGELLTATTGNQTTSYNSM